MSSAAKMLVGVGLLIGAAAVVFVGIRANRFWFVKNATDATVKAATARGTRSEYMWRVRLSCFGGALILSIVGVTLIANS